MNDRIKEIEAKLRRIEGHQKAGRSWSEKQWSAWLALSAELMAEKLSADFHNSSDKESDVESH